MSRKPRVLAIVPARGGSRGIPRKNLQLVGGKPLVALAAAQGLRAKQITHVLVSSEDEEIRAVAEKAGAMIMNRPEEFHHDNSIQEVDRLLVWTVREFEKQEGKVDVVVLLYPTAPLRDVETIDEAIGLVLNDKADSVLSIYEDSSYLWRVDGPRASPTNYDPKTRGPRQKEEWNQWVENKAIYAVRRDLLLDTGCRLGQRIGYVQMRKIDSVDVDSPEDLELVRMLYDRK